MKRKKKLRATVREKKSGGGRGKGCNTPVNPASCTASDHPILRSTTNQVGRLRYSTYKKGGGERGNEKGKRREVLMMNFRKENVKRTYALVMTRSEPKRSLP